MNIIYLHCHDAGQYVEPYMDSVETPHLRRFSKDAVVFSNAFCAAPTCSPSRAALLTGQSAHESGMTGLAHLGHHLLDKSQHIASLLEKNGYETILCGQHHVGAPDVYQQNLQPETQDLDKRDDQTVQLAVHWLRTPRVNPEKPFFLDIGFFFPHRPYLSSGLPYQGPLPACLPDTPAIRADFSDFLASVQHMDSCVGTVLEQIRQSGYYDNSLIVFTTDHGIAFPRMKCNLYDDGIRVALMMRYPGSQKVGTAVNAMVSHLDVYAALCESAGISKPDWCEGESLLQLLDGRAESIRSRIFAEVNYHVDYEPMRCIRTPQYKYIRSYGKSGTICLDNTDTSPSKLTLLAEGYAGTPRPKEELYDLELDPHEQNNLAEDVSLQTIRTKLAAELNDWMKQTRDPLLKEFTARYPDFSRMLHS